ncbi:helix-turn-helix domain-containing protein [Lutispora thermophila]|uniref:Transcriptional regulator, contains XRE-family HTH domain n=1 Tax=Lutispora thermophila DSM 19022 TaxID=1122184 RepID=A0A1M6DL71_9FIRM|nr:helix-turn-helix transcriptional regulator [Lutispora thermophila]SHI73748.1 Transcriptional regulator, contains XRE-family HTH domain [Lutispora thermophila DSM 19022]
MDSSLGSKIKKLRKELKMTQAQLAEPEMTKSMLSQIENGLAMPSMKSLQFIAKKLNKPVSYFIDESSDHLVKNDNDDKDSYDHIVNELKKIDELIKSNAFKEALVCIEELEHLTSLYDNSKLMGDILYKKGQCMMELDKLAEAVKLFYRAYEIYLNNNFYIEAAKSYAETTTEHWRNFEYGKCIDIYLKAKEIYDKSPNRDIHFEIELLHGLSVFYSAIGDFDVTSKYLDDALEISKTTGVYYKADELYRSKAVMNYIQGDHENYKINIEKAEQFAVFTENKVIMKYIYSVKVVHENAIGNYDKALEYLEQMKKVNAPHHEYFYYREKAKALYYLGKYDEALENIKHVFYPDYASHKLDYLMMWSTKVYEGLIYSKLGQLNKSIDPILTAIEKMKKFGSSRLLAFALESASDIYYQMGEFEKAYNYLKEANHMKNDIIKNKIYF